MRATYLVAVDPRLGKATARLCGLNSPTAELDFVHIQNKSRAFLVVRSLAMSRFVAAGGTEPTAPSDGSKEAAREDAWAQAQKQLEAMRAKSKPQAGKQEDGKSLYEVLQANKGRCSLNSFLIPDS